MTKNNKPVVAHSVSEWLPLTMTWLYNQIKYLDNFSSIVIANSLMNFDKFPWNPVYIENSDRLKHLVFKIMQKSGIRRPHFIYGPAIKKHHPLILHSHFGNRGWTDLAAARKYRLKHIVTFYGFDVNMLPLQIPAYRKRYIELFDKAAFILCEGSHMAKCIAALGCPEKKIIVQPIGVEVEKIAFIPRKTDNSGLIKILIASTFREKKGIPYALEAIGNLRERYPNIRATIIGDATEEKRDKEEKSRIINVIKKYRLESILSLFGFVSQNVLWKEAYKHHIFLSPSVTATDGDTEGGAPVSLIEMSASGMPIVSTRHCDIPEIVEDGVTGLLIEERDVGGLMNALEILINNPDKWSEYGYNGRRRIEARHDVRDTTKRIEKLYKEVING